ncbi:MAG: type I DNA topoisomerase [Patescibacteria group bacterium]|nr:type I DNA topoisomerase [Patescibacteria group bacterium]
MKLLIVESPSKAKTISKYLGNGYTVRASIGHIRDLPKSNKKAVDIEGGFVPHYEVVAKKQPVIDEIAELAGRAEEVILATDPDREGEAIAWHIAEVLKDRLGAGVRRKLKRASYHEITKDAVLEALAHPRAIDQHLREAQEARRVLDRIVGYDLSGLVWKKVRYGLSAGRVQSPALRIIMEREREIRAFKPETYWVIAGQWQTTARDRLTLFCSEEPRNKNRVERIIEAAKRGTWRVISLDESEQKRSPRAPFITSTLQQAASSRLGFSPSRTMSVAQKLYEAGYITYMRTDSTNLGNAALTQIAGLIEKKFGADYLEVRKYTAKSKNAQEAHEAIRPTHFSKESAGHTDEQKRLYRLIWQRAIASQMADAKIARSKIIANIDGRASPDGTQDEIDGQIPDFEATGSRVLFDGWMKADPESESETIILPKVVAGDPLQLQSIDSVEKQTQPPSRYTEAGLIKELEKRGIGRPSTYASITKTIEDRGYVAIENKSLKPTDTGDVVSSFLEEYFPAYISDSFTADMEDQLDDIANGTRKYVDTLRQFYGPFHKDVTSKEKIDKITNLGTADPKFKCPVCGSSMVIKLGKNGKFLSCSRYPDCDGALTIDGLEFKKDEPIGTDPTTGLPIFVLNGRYGPYVQLGIQPPKKTAKPRSKKTGKSVASSASPTDVTPEPKPVKPRMASIPKSMDPMKVTVADALTYLSLPKVLGTDPATGKEITASIGRFGPFIVRDGDFRSVKAPDNIYTIDLKRALEIFAQPKAKRGFQRKKKE